MFTPILLFVFGAFMIWCAFSYYQSYKNPEKVTIREVKSMALVMVIVASLSGILMFLDALTQLAA